MSVSYLAGITHSSLGKLQSTSCDPSLKSPWEQRAVLLHYSPPLCTYEALNSLSEKKYTHKAKRGRYKEQVTFKMSISWEDSGTWDSYVEGDERLKRGRKRGEGKKEGEEGCEIKSQRSAERRWVVLSHSSFQDCTETQMEALMGFLTSIKAIRWRYISKSRDAKEFVVQIQVKLLQLTIGFSTILWTTVPTVDPALSTVWPTLNVQL